MEKVEISVRPIGEDAPPTDPPRVEVETHQIYPGEAKVFVLIGLPDGGYTFVEAGEYGPSDLTDHVDDLRLIGGRVTHEYQQAQQGR